MSQIQVQENDRQSKWSASAAQEVFNYDFPITAESELTVTKKAIADGAVTNPSILSSTINASGGTVTIAACADGDLITIQGNIPVERSSNYLTYVVPTDLNYDFNKLTKMVQELRRDIGVSLSLPPQTGSGVSSELPEPLADSVIGWDSGGTALEYTLKSTMTNPDVVSQVDAEAGTATDERIWTAERVKQAILALETGEPDQTGAEIKALYEAEANAFTDALFTKLAGIELLADVTDATNVNAVESDPVVGAINGLVKANGAGTIAVAVEDTDYQGVLAEGAFVDGDKTKLDGIAIGATANVGDVLADGSVPFTAQTTVDSGSWGVAGSGDGIGDFLVERDGTAGIQVLCQVGSIGRLTFGTDTDKRAGEFYYDSGSDSLGATVSNGTVWVCGPSKEFVCYGVLNQKKGSNVASASTLPLIHDGNIITVTGTTNIDKIANLSGVSSSGYGPVMYLEFSGVLTLNHGTYLKLPNDQNITTRAGDIGIFVQTAYANPNATWECVYHPSAKIPVSVIDTGEITADTTTEYTLLSSDDKKTVTLNNAGATVLDVADGLPVGFTCNVVQLGAGAVTLTPDTDTINVNAGLTLVSNGQYAGVTLVKYASGLWVACGDLVPA
jgi:hypothetical protein